MYLLKAGHIAVLTELITKNGIANGDKGMFAYGTEVVKSRFGQVNAMFALDLLIHGVVRAFNRTLDFVTGLLPIPGPSSLMASVNSILYAATTYIDETLFSYNLARGAFLKPLFLIMIMTRFHVCVQNQPIDETWDEMLSNASDKFRQIKARALEATAGHPAPATT